MLDKKVINEEELENVSGGKAGHDDRIICSNCKKAYTRFGATGKREVDDGCSSYNEHQCPDCGAWNKG